MTRQRRFRLVWRALYVVAGTFAFLLILTGGVYLAGGRWNMSPSTPLGLYWVSRTPIAVGAFVMVCPPETPIFQQARERTYIEAGSCPGHYGHMIKQVVALAGDVIAITTQGVRVNGHLLPDSAPTSHDPKGRAMPVTLGAQYTLGSRQLLLMGLGNRLAFDGRYFGPVGTETVRTVLKPVYTWTPRE